MPTTLDPTANLTDRVDPTLPSTAIAGASNEDVTPKVEKVSANLDPCLPDRDHGHQDHYSKTHGNFLPPSMLALWIQEALRPWLLEARYMHENDCLFVCRGCEELHNMGQCPMEEFYNQIRQWFSASELMGISPEAAEKMLN
ncbi:LOW QUALITY PROTEIN: hypothetical protein PHMEG_00015000 [Phytophthora megakarya]|uniref:Eukaryotic/viral aspartic protease n=1 Tax=Phytophthora megakarya TaxID=4795 RepID=A0A225W2Y6_9STRA|nr:LOW QUALITY PROTEIN: hypothetical protein PHMEG_00015000 [Phytophthora megakarya]